MKRNKFNLSNYKLFSCDGGELVPCGLLEVLPGDTIQQATSLLVRASPLLAPIYHPIHATIHHWFVPHRLVWEDFEDFITGGPDGLNASVFPTKTLNASVGQLADYLGFPTGVTIAGSALPFRVYNLIWNEWYRDQDLQTAQVVNITSGNDNTTPSSLLNRNWEKDYFTSARPWEQKGPAITIPIGTTAPVITTGATPLLTNSLNTNIPFAMGNDGGAASTQLRLGAGSTGSSANVNTQFGSTTGLQANLASASAVTINILREALALQRFEEARARYGSRYVEYLRYLGIRSSDARLQRPEYLGGGKQTIQFSEVLQTAPTTSGSAAGVGALKGHGIASLRSNRYRRFFEEHGYVISLFSIRPRTMYVQGLPRTWNRRTKEDFFQKELQHIGQQEVLNKEVYAAHTTPEGIFGYQDRYDEYRRAESTIGGEFRSTTLDFWHQARIFASDPALNSTFVSCVPTERNFASSATDVYWIMANHHIQARRQVAASGTSFIF